MVKRILSKKFRKTTEPFLSDKTFTTEKITLVYVKDKGTAKTLNIFVWNIATNLNIAKTDPIRIQKLHFC